MTAPINTNTGGDIQQALNTFVNGDIGNTITVAAQNGKVNKWAKYKPIASTDWDYSEQLDKTSSNPSQWAWKNTATWWQGPDGKCGLNIQSFVDFGSMTNSITFLYKLIHGELGWEYVCPTTRFRLFDFIGYNANAIKPVGSELPVTDFWLSTQGLLQFGYDIENIGSDNLSLNDLSINSIPLSQHYLGVVLYQGTRWWALTSTAKLGTGSADITINDASSLVGSWNVIPFLSTTQMTIGSTIGEGQYASFDVTTPQTIVIHAAGTIIDINVYGEWNQAGTTVSWELVAYNASSTTRTLTNIVVYLYATDADVPSQAPESGQNMGSSNAGSLVVPGNGRAYLSGTITPRLPKSSAYTYWIFADTDGDYHKNYNQVEDYSADPI